MNTKEKIKKIIESISENPIEWSSFNKINLVNDIGFNSLHIIEFIVGLENEFDIELDTLDYSDIIDYEKIVQIVQGYLK